MPLGLWTQVGQRNHVLDCSGPIRPMPRVIFRGKPEKDMPGRAGQHCAVSCAKMAESIEMPFGLWTRVGPKEARIS